MVSVEYPDKMFKAAVAGAQQFATKCIPGNIYRCEYLQSVKHNTLLYGRIPVHNLILFDVEAPWGMLNRAEMENEATKIGMEVVPLLFEGVVTLPVLDNLIATTQSCLGGSIEGVVLKRHDLLDTSGKPLVAKYVSAAFKESHQNKCNKTNPDGKDAVLEIGDKYRVEARWRKAVQYLRDCGEINGTPEDIGMIIKKAKQDLLEEHYEDIVSSLNVLFLGKIQTQSVKGLVEWYKEELAKLALENE